MLNINFNLKEATAQKETPINVILRYNNLRLKYPSGMKIHPRFWNSDDQLAMQTKKFREFPEFNARLRKLKSDINQAYLSYLNENGNEIPTTATLKSFLDVRLGRVEQIKYTFLTYFQKYINTLEVRVNNKTGKLISKVSIGCYKNTLNILKEFQKVYHRPIVFENIDLDFYHDLLEYLSKTKQQATNTIGKIIRNIKVILNDATENGHNANLSYKGKRFVSVSEKSFSIYLNEHELEQLYNFNLSNNKKLEVVRDLFLIGCYTGLRYSDYSNIKPENIQGEFIEIQTQKTGVTVAIPLHRIVRDILQKYNNVLPKSISNQKTNEYLKEIGKKDKEEKLSFLHENITKTITKGGLQVETNYKKYELLSSHVGRRSFASNLYLSGFPAISIMKITGHTTEKSFMKYIKITPKENAKLLQMHWDNQPKLRVV
jgi:integrase